MHKRSDSKLADKASEHQQNLFLCYVDFEKAFHSISHELLWITMMEIGYTAHIIDLLTKLYRKQKARVRVADTISGVFRVRRGARQGHVLSPSLFNILVEMVTWEQKARVRVADTSGVFRVTRGVRQGRVLSPSLFNIIVELVTGSKKRGSGWLIHRVCFELHEE